MYIMQFEGDEPKYATEITEDDKKAADDGYLTIIDISNSEDELPSIYYDGEWHDLESWSN